MLVWTVQCFSLILQDMAAFGLVYASHLLLQVVGRLGSCVMAPSRQESGPSTLLKYTIGLSLVMMTTGKLKAYMS